MLEGLVTWVLNNYLGKYVENLNTAQLSIALLSGEVELENLPLKKDALRHLGLPLEIKSGFIGKIKLQIPVRQIWSKPWVVLIEQLYLVATPLPVQDWDINTENLFAHEQKLSELDKLEANWRVNNDPKEGSNYYSSSYSSWLTYGTGFITDIIENLQLKIQDVHIRYEDSLSVPQRGVAFGITMESFSTQSCDKNWQSGFSAWESAQFSFKLVEMQKLSIYWCELEYSELLANCDKSQLATAMKLNSNQSNNCAKYRILQPVSAQARMKRNRSEKPLRSEEPRITCELQLDQVPLFLVDWQYIQIVKCVNGLEDISRFRKYRKFRPMHPVKDDARAWWLYFISCAYPGGQPKLCKPRFDLDAVLERWRGNHAYINLYSKILMSPTIALSFEEKALKDEVEWSRDFQELKVLRDLAMSKVPTQSRCSTWKNSAGSGTLLRWFPQWVGWYLTTGPTESAPSEGPTDLEGAILEALSSTRDEYNFLKRDAVFVRMNFTLNAGTLYFCSGDSQKEADSILELQFENLCLNVTSKPRSASMCIELSLQSLYLHDKFTPNTKFPILVGPPEQKNKPFSRASSRVPQKSTQIDNECVFQMVYEKKPDHSTYQYRLIVKTNSLEIVYQHAAIKWLVEFLCLPHQKKITQSQIEAMKLRTKKELMKNWEQIMDSRLSARKSWDLQLDITAPRIIFVEDFQEKSASIAVVDFGRLHLRNNLVPAETTVALNGNSKEDDDDEFVTPCSTPPVSEEEESDSEFSSQNVTQDTYISESSLHTKLYDRYFLEMSDMQILIAKVKDNWRYGHNKGTSPFHMLDSFNISLQIERRIIHTYDPQYPNLTFNVNLPKLVAHINEQKIAAARKITQIITATGLPSPFGGPDTIEEAIINNIDDEESFSNDTSAELSTQLLMQFTVDHLALEVQSRERCIAELQVSVVKFVFTKKPSDISATLSVHSLLLVDALQQFGPDFELLVASHKHVGMDSMSGSLWDSEPTSPNSPGSPDLSTRNSATSPVALNVALSSLATSPPPLQQMQNFQDAEALITLELHLVFGNDPMQIATIQFNNLDIIANQQTIVELMGFIQRVFPDLKNQKSSSLIAKAQMEALSPHNSQDSLESKPNMGKTNITFDFHRLNVLLFRGMYKDGQMQAKKICTTTMSEAKIKATVQGTGTITVQGSLGGLQIMDLTPEGNLHQRIVSVGKDPHSESVHPLYSMSSGFGQTDNTALRFQVVRTLQRNPGDEDKASITVRMASLWYTHAPHFLQELQSCATEFKQYLANLAKSISTAATDMALGLVHARAEALAQSIYMNSRLSASIYGSALSFTDLTSPRRRRRSSSMDQYSGYSSVRDTYPQTPYSPHEDDDFKIDIEINIVLNSPIIILPRFSNSNQVFVAHLGKITIGNEKPLEESQIYDEEELYKIEVRDMNLFSLDIASRREPGPIMPKMENLYSCKTEAKPILHNTVIELEISREKIACPRSRHHSFSSMLVDDDSSSNNNYNSKENISIKGNVVNPLKISLTRAQYEQVLDTINWLSSSQNESQNLVSKGVSKTMLTDIIEEDTGVTTLKMDPHVRAKLFPNALPKHPQEETDTFVSVKILFELPEFTIEFRGDSPIGEQALVDLMLREFTFVYDKCHRYETNIHVSLRSIFMEDLLQPEGSKQRCMVVSSAGEDMPMLSSCGSRSCPDISNFPHGSNSAHGSLPDNFESTKTPFLERSNTITMDTISRDSQSTCPNTPPPSPSRSRPQRNLVLISTLLVDPNAPNFSTQYNSVSRSTSVDFNCLDLVINMDSWIVVLDFFGASSTSPLPKPTKQSFQTDDMTQECTENTNISIRSLTMVLVKPERDIAKANISKVELVITKEGRRKEVVGFLGSISLLDLTSHGNLYRERFVTSGMHALKFKYVRHGSEQIKDFDSQLVINTSSVMYVHTKRFVVEIQAFFHHFAYLQTVMGGIRKATSGQTISDEPSRLSLVIEANSPVILLPVSSKSSDLVIIDLGQLKLSNCFKFSGDNGTISVPTNENGPKCLLDVMHLDLQNVNLQPGIRVSDFGTPSAQCYRLGNASIERTGDSLLTKKFHLKIQVERNLNDCHEVPDMSIHGELSTLDCTLDLNQYKLVRGFLDHNLGENTEHILPSVRTPFMAVDHSNLDIWILSSLKLDLLNVTVRLQENKQSSPLACINFIKSRLTVESFSNLSQDIDLISQEIQILDTRYENLPRSKRPNAFSEILKPVKSAKHKDLVQVEIHSRKRQNYSKFTILLNSMRLYAIFDWWESAKEFIFQQIDAEPPSPKRAVISEPKIEDEIPMEFKLNITDSEVVIVENASVLNTNAVILKSTTVLSYRSLNEKPLSCNLNNCEVYSCILDLAEQTALSIIDPVTLNIDINKEKILECQLQTLTLRLSYYDVLMFSKILNSLPKQYLAAKNEILDESDSKQKMIDKLSNLGFSVEDCVAALKACENKLDDAALWLTQNATPRSQSSQEPTIKGVEVKADKIFICIIDDCGDADTPLLEFSLSHIYFQQNLQNSLENPTKGLLKCMLACDYYNRILSGWEPILEAWNCCFMYGSSTLQNLPNRIEIKIASKEVLNVNVTSTFLELYKQVRDSWIKDFYASKSGKLLGSSHKERKPFVPYVLRNETGLPLHYSTLIAEVDDGCLDSIRSSKNDGHNLKLVAPGERVKFSFKSRDKIRHSDTHKMHIHQLGVQVAHFNNLAPVTVDKVGVYFREAVPKLIKENEPQISRIVFDVALADSARKLVTVRSALQLINKLPERVEVKLESPTLTEMTQTIVVQKGRTLNVPLMHAFSKIYIRPCESYQRYNYCNSPIDWKSASKPNEVVHDMKKCTSTKGLVYRFCAEIKRENYPPDRSTYKCQPAHTISLLPNLLLVNLLPLELSYSIVNISGHINPGAEMAHTCVDTDGVVEIKLKLENFPKSCTLTLPSGTTSFNSRLRLEDDKGRKLFLSAAVSPHTDSKVKVTITAPYWIINRTGLPLVFRQHGVNTESAGQNAENEVARMVAPLLFSFSDPGASNTVSARVGSHAIKDGNAQWCQHFHLQRGIQVRKIRVSLRDGRPDVVFLVGIEVRQGRGKYRATNIVTISPRYQLHNRSSYTLKFAQKCFTHKKDDHNYIKAIPNGNTPFHWPRLEQDLLVCVTIEDIPSCCWSGGLKIDVNYSMHVNVRDTNSRIYFLRLEVVQEGATFFVIFTDADTMPPPIRIDNFSEVTVKFAQYYCKDDLVSAARAHSSVPYAWDHPTKPMLLNVVAPGGVSHTYDVLGSLGKVANLTYENFIYIAFSATFKQSHSIFDPKELSSQELVLDVDSKSGRIFLARKKQGERSQLWRMTSTGQLQHEGSSPPSLPNQPRPQNFLVLDIEDTAPQPSTYTRLVLRRLTPNRKSTQTWKFTEDGRLMCIHSNMYVQSQDGFMGLREGSLAYCSNQRSAAVLGLSRPESRNLTEKGIPVEQAIERQKLRPGSGFLNVEITTDGPTRVLVIKDIKELNISNASGIQNSLAENDADFISENEVRQREYELRINFAGLGISLTSRRPAQELLYARFFNIESEFILCEKLKRLLLRVEDIQIDNQLFEAPSSNFLFVTPTKGLSEPQPRSALTIGFEIQPSLNEKAMYFNYLSVIMKKLTVHLEERLLLKLFEFISYNSNDEELQQTVENDHETQRIVTNVTAAHAKRYYFGRIHLVPDQIRLSMITATKLPSSLQNVKKRLGLTFIKFEDAGVDLEPYIREHPFETMQVLVHSIVKHFKDELLWQAGIILGSVDFLGNPIGFMNDVSEGVTGLIYEGNVAMLFKNVTHGISNSAAKVTESLSDGLGKVTMDEEHEELRQKIRQNVYGSSKEHLMAGIKGLGVGVLGGATGIFKQMYEGASNEGIPGFFGGIGKGIVGAVTKPVVGVLDFASETARAVRDSSRSSSRLTPDRLRPPRCVVGPGGLLPKYSSNMSKGQQYLYNLNDRDFSELLVAFESLRSGFEDLQVIITNKRVCIVTSANTPQLKIVIESQLSDLDKCRPTEELKNGEKHQYIELWIRVNNDNLYQVTKKPKIRCDSMEVAKLVTTQVNYAKRLYDEGKLTLSSDNISQNED